MLGAVESVSAGAVDLVEHWKSLAIELRELGVKFLVSRAGSLARWRANVVVVLERRLSPVLLVSFSRLDLVLAALFIA